MAQEATSKNLPATKLMPPEEAMKKPIELNWIDWFCIRYLRKDKARAKAIIKEALGDVHVHKNPKRKEQEAVNG